MSLPDSVILGPGVTLGRNVRFTGFANLYGCVVGDDCLIGPFVEIQRDASVGSRVKIQSHAFVCSGVRIEDEAFIGHGVMFTNDRYPRSTNPDGSLKGGEDWTCEPTFVGRRASIGSNATILCGVRIGADAVVGAGSVVVADVPPRAVVAGNPSKILRFLDNNEDEHPVKTTLPVPFLDLPAQNRALREDILAMVGRALDKAQFIGGPEVSGFEAEFAAFTGVPHCVGVGSGTDALRLALLAMGVGPGDAVVTVPNTFIATVEAISQAGGVPVFVDIDPRTCLMDPGRLEELLLARQRAGLAPPKAVVPVHLYGQCADMVALTALAGRFGFALLEDAAQAHGASRAGRAAGAVGQAAAFSFYPGKNLGACGEAGAVTTADPGLADAVRMLRDHGQKEKYIHRLEGYNARLDAIQAGVLRLKLRRLAGWNARRREIAARYLEAFADLPAVRPVQPAPDSLPVWHLFVVHVPQRDLVRQRLAARDIQTGLHYPVPLHLQQCYARLGYKAGDFPEAERSAASLLSLPMFPEMTAAQTEAVIAAVRDAVEGL